MEERGNKTRQKRGNMKQELQLSCKNKQLHLMAAEDGVTNGAPVRYNGSADEMKPKKKN